MRRNVPSCGILFIFVNASILDLTAPFEGWYLLKSAGGFTIFVKGLIDGVAHLVNYSSRLLNVSGLTGGFE